MARRKADASAPAPAAQPAATQVDTRPASPPPARMRLSAAPPGGPLWPQAMRVAPPPVALDATIDAEFSATQLRELARTLGITFRGTSKTGYIEQAATELRARMARANRDPELMLAGLDPEQAALVRRALTARDHTLPFPRSLAATLVPRAGATLQDAERRLTELLEGLRRRALIFPSRFTYFGTYRDIFYQWPPMADDALVPVVEWERPAARPGKDAVRPAAATFLSDMDQVLGAIFAAPLELRPPLPAHPNAPRLTWLRKWEHDPAEVEKLLRARAGWAPDPRAGVKVIPDDLIGPAGGVRLNGQTGLPPEECGFLVSLAAGLNLITAPEPAASPRISPIRPQQYETWLSLSDEDKLVEAWQCWTGSLVFGVEAALAGVTAYRAVGASDLEPAHLGAEWCGLRRFVTRVLRGIPDGVLTDWPALQRSLWEFHPACANAFLARDVYWLANDKGQREELTRFDSWAAGTGAILEAILTGPLTWFGVIEPVLRGGRLSAFTVTETGRWLIEQRWADGAPLPAAARPAQRATEPVAWTSSEVWRLPPAPERANYLGFARLISDPAGPPFTYRITTASLERALLAGLGPAEAAERFAELGAPMPASASRRFQAIAERFGRIRAYESVSILTLGDDLALRELMAATSLREAIVYEISPRAVVVRSDAIDALIEELTTKGFTPGVKP